MSGRDRGGGGRGLRCLPRRTGARLDWLLPTGVEVEYPRTAERAVWRKEEANMLRLESCGVTGEDYSARERGAEVWAVARADDGVRLRAIGDTAPVRPDRLVARRVGGRASLRKRHPGVRSGTLESWDGERSHRAQRCVVLLRYCEAVHATISAPISHLSSGGAVACGRWPRRPF